MKPRLLRAGLRFATKEEFSNLDRRAMPDPPITGSPVG